MTTGQAFGLMAVGIVAGGAVGYFVGLVVGHNRGANFRRQVEVIQQMDRLAVWLTDRCTILRRLVDDQTLGIPTRAQARERLSELQALSLAVFVSDPDVRLKAALDEVRNERAPQAQ